MDGISCSTLNYEQIDGAGFQFTPVCYLTKTKAPNVRPCMTVTLTNRITFEAKNNKKKIKQDQD